MNKFIRPIWVVPMKKQITLLSALLIGLFLLTGCTGLSTEEIQNKMVEANSNVDTYTVDMDMKLDMTMELFGSEMEIGTDMDATGAVDRPNKAMFLEGIMNLEMWGMKEEMDMEIYIIDDYLYTQSMGYWSKEELTEDIWSEQDQIEQAIELINSGTIERLDDEDNYYVIKVDPDLQVLAEQVLQQQDQSDFFSEDMDFEDMIKEYTAVIWINKDSFVIEKSLISVKMVMTPENSGETELEGNLGMDMTVRVEISNINQEVDITLPKAAKDAVDMDDMWDYDYSDYDYEDDYWY
ncbi:DUF6612 family protein [Nanoarchaeota archaeon]